MKQCGGWLGRKTGGEEKECYCIYMMTKILPAGEITQSEISHWNNKNDKSRECWRFQSFMWVKTVQCVCSIHLIQTNQTISKHLTQTFTFWINLDWFSGDPLTYEKIIQEGVTNAVRRCFSVSHSPVLRAWIPGDQALRQHGFSWTGLKKGLNPATALVSAPMCEEAQESTARVLQNDLQMLICMLLNKE